ncbi:hypothetical protein MM326_13920 [Alkalihalobacillus sp. LMS6]|jgi:flagellar biosynthesis/type III secretory pathway protein FliH|uniref:hypothetical protein n=1 Tax=Alkalihalobacillus sp. LMS6 TaxID=2924034 RepID=UPI0020D1944C|nr:hypothetical protein [Alkalihalobacillus sp. LMS6]UTR05200.1 hypothetical protein MM326_13920 [Alkalihalobacillus sp. LMS6]
MTNHNGILGGDFDAKALDHAHALHEYVQAAVRKGYAEGFEAGREFERGTENLWRQEVL